MVHIFKNGFTVDLCLLTQGKLLMTNEIEIFNNPSFGSVRAFSDENGEPWFCGNDVATALGYVNPRDALEKHCKEKGVAKRDTPTSGGLQVMTYINEANMYRLVFGSKLKTAEQFQDWVVEDVLPALRKTGSYSVTKSPFDVIAQDMDPLARLDAMKEIILQQRKLQEAAVAKEKEKTMIVHSALSNVKDQYVTLDKRYRNTMDIIQEFSKGVCGASVTDAAKAISSHNKFGVKVSGKQLMEFLRAKELILKNNTPSQKAIDEGVLVAEFIVITNGNKRWPKLLTKITSKGLVYVTDLLLKEVLKQEGEQFSLF